MRILANLKHDANAFQANSLQLLVKLMNLR